MAIPNKIIWVLVADSEQAYFFTRTSEQRLLPMPRGKMRVINEHAHKLKNINEDMKLERTKTDYANQFEGRTHDRMGQGSHRLAPHTSVHEYEEYEFIKSVAKHINEADLKNKFDSLIIVAPPETLGILRKELSGQVTDKISATVKKGLAHMVENNPSYVEQHLQSVL
jgi:protein required for attachment to host cells